MSKYMLAEFFQILTFSHKMSSENKNKTKFFFLLFYCSLRALQITVILRSTYKSEVSVDKLKTLSFEIVANSSRRTISQVAGD